MTKQDQQFEQLDGTRQLCVLPSHPSAAAGGHTFNDVERMNTESERIMNSNERRISNTRMDLTERMNLNERIDLDGRLDLNEWMSLSERMHVKERMKLKERTGLFDLDRAMGPGADQRHRGNIMSEFTGQLSCVSCPCLYIGILCVHCLPCLYIAWLSCLACTLTVIVHWYALVFTASASH